jgi:catechol 2,3-dioxygenase-like lactoylglutathione lyase family enzyme
VSTDIPRTKQFYVDVLGAKPLPREWPAGVELAGTVIDIFPAVDDQQPLPGSLGQHHAYNIRLEEYDAWAEHIRAHDAPLLLACHGPRLMTMYTRDPDGYHIELVVEFETAEEGRREIDKRGIKPYSNLGRPTDKP